MSRNFAPTNFARGVAFLTAIALALPSPPAFAQPKPPAAAETEATEFNLEQLDAMLAPIALYPDDLLTQILMASTYPLQVVAAGRWIEKDDNKKLKGDALVTALEKEVWDPSVKSLVPFPQVVVMMNENLEWTEQLGYAVATQLPAVLDSVQRLRRQAQKSGSLKTTEQQRVVVKEETVIIQPSNPETVHVPVYQPANVYGEWPYPNNPPVYIPPPQEYYPAAYAPGYAWGAGLAFAAGAAVVGGLWGWANPGWGYGNVSINRAAYNNINVNRGALQSNVWRPPARGVGGRPARAPGGPVGRPVRPGQLPTNAIGRSSVRVPGSAVNRPRIPAAGGGIAQGRPGGAGRVQRPGGGQGRPLSAAQRPAGQGLGAGRLSSGAQRPGGGQLSGRGNSLGAGRGSAGARQRPAGAFGGIGDGARASQFGARGAQSRGFQQAGMRRGGGGFGGGGGMRSSAGGGFRGGGGGFRGGGGGGFRGGGGGGFRGGGGRRR